MSTPIHRAFTFAATLLAFMAVPRLQAAYPASNLAVTADVMAGFSSVFDYQSSSYHCAYIDISTGQVKYLHLSPSGAVLANGASGDVANTLETSEFYAKTSISFDSQSRPVIAYTRKTSSRSIRLARWNGSVWLDEEVRGETYSTRLSLDLYMRDATKWRVAYIDYTGSRLGVASAGGQDHEVATFPDAPDETGFHLRYSANSGSMVFRDPESGYLKFANLVDGGSGVGGTSVSIVDDSTDAGTEVYWCPDSAGWPNFVYRDETSGEIVRAWRRPDFNWSKEVVIRPTFGRLGNPTLAFDTHGIPMVACTDEAGDRIRFAAKVGGKWYEDQIDTADFYRRPLLLCPQPQGGFRALAVGQVSNQAAMKLVNIGPIDDFIDADGDGIPLRLENAFMMSPSVSDRHRLPIPSTRIIGGQRRMVLTVRQAPGGTASGGVSYETATHVLRVEASKDLVNWVSNPATIQLADAFTLGGVRFAESYLSDPVGTEDGYRFMRVRVERK